MIAVSDGIRKVSEGIPKESRDRQRQLAGKRLSRGDLFSTKPLQLTRSLGICE